MIGKLENQQIEDVLCKNVIGRLGCHANNKTYVVPISYAYDGTYIYGHTYEGMKIKMMRENPEVCFEVDTMENMANWKSVICQGKYEELTDSDERKKGIQKLLDRVLPIITSETVQITPHWPFPPSDLNKVNGIVYRVRLFEKSGRFEKNDAGSYYAS
jgi:nitroimidazol reductase NimA-like FMN-containing flavoprotein (pyridoxamine 5'-phosphate oxidase superfamily)